MTTARTATSPTIDDYLDQLASSAPAPGGGSVAGVTAALSAALGQMVCNLSIKNDADAPSPLRAARERLAELHKRSLAASRADESAFTGYLDARKLPKNTSEEKAHRRRAMQQAITTAATVPLELSEFAIAILAELPVVIENGTEHVLSDAEIATILGQAGAQAALVNVRVNLPLIKDEAVRTELEARCHAAARAIIQRHANAASALKRRAAL